MLSPPPPHPVNSPLGISPTISFGKPTEAECRSREKLVKFLADSHPVKSAQDLRRQNDAVNSLAKILKDWVKELATIHKRPVEKANAELFTFGSYHLQVDKPGDDIDTLCVGPKEVNREHDFFNELRVKLLQMVQVTKIERVPDAHVPFMKFKLDGVSIKLVYASFSNSIVPENLDISGRYVLQGIDEVTVRSLNGRRVSAKILKLVPDIENFRTTLRCVKHWANTRDICSNDTGFLEDCDWAILVARVCQLYPSAVPSTLVRNFFKHFSKWTWPNPVLLCHIDKDMQLGFPVWNSANNPDLMPIITPAYPCRNSRIDASESTRSIMTQHFSFGYRKCTVIMDDNVDWAELFKPFNFFEAFVRYLHVDIMTDNDEDLRTLKEMVEPELWQLMLKIERDGELICYLCPIEYTRGDCCAFFIGLLDKENVNEVPDKILAEFECKVNASMKPGMKLQCHQVLGANIKSHKWGKQSLPVLQVAYNN